MALKDTEYIFASSNIRANEGAISYSERLAEFLECKTVDELYEAVLGTENSGGGTKKEQIEESLDRRLNSAISLVLSIVPEKRVYDFLLYEYDCCNLKTIIKSSVKNMSYDGLVYECGTIPPDKIADAVRENRFDILPNHMAKAAKEAIEAFAKTKDPKEIDLIIDKACFADMLDNAERYGYKTFISLVKTRIDKINIVTFARISKFDIADKTRALEKALLDGGTISKSVFLNHIDGYDGNLESVLTGTSYYETVLSLGADYTFSQLEKSLEDIYLSAVRNIKFVSFGAEVPCAYIINTVYEIKNIRIILAGICSSFPQQKIKERVRLGYV